MTLFRNLKHQHIKNPIMKKESNAQSEIVLNNEENENSYEKCALCDTILPILKKTPIEERKYYIVGAGQLCPVCFNYLFGWGNDNYMIDK